MMLRVYLDQNHWISLTKARVGHKEGTKYEDALVLLREAVKQGWVSCPLSMQHFMETQNRSDWESRLQLVGTMEELSCWHAIAPQNELLGSEIDHALNEVFGHPRFPRSVQVFGIGADHAIGRSVTDYAPPADAPLTPDQRALLRQVVSQIKQTVILTGAPSDFKAPGYDPTAHRRVSEGFAEEQERLRNVRRVKGLHTGDLGRRAASVDVYNEFEKSYSEALKLAGLTWDHVFDLGEKGMELLIRSVPTVFVHRELRRFRHAASQKRWEEGDLVDLTALASAIVYCDVVVTERVWTDIAGRAKLGQQFNTAVLRDLKSLMPHLVGAATY